MVQGGHQPFGANVALDHRFFLDFETGELFKRQSSLDNDDPAKLSHKDKTMGKAFLDKSDKLIDSRNLVTGSTGPLQANQPNHQKAEQINRDVKNFVLNAETKAMERTGPLQWTLESCKLQTKTMICQLQITQELTRVNMHNQIQKFTKKCKLNNIPTTAEEAIQMLPSPRKELLQLQKPHVQQCCQEQENRILALELSWEPNDIDKAKVIRRIKKAETLKKIFRKIGSARKFKSGKLTRLRVRRKTTTDPKEIPDEEHHWMEVTETEDMLNALMQRNRKHFGQRNAGRLLSSKSL